MNEQKSPTANDVTPTGDELRDGSPEGDSDSEFLAELDRILAPESNVPATPADSDHARSEPEEAQTSTEAARDLEPDMEISSFDFDLSTDGESLELESTFENLVQEGVDERSPDEQLEAQPEAADESLESKPPKLDTQGPLLPHESLDLLQADEIRQPEQQPTSRLEETETGRESEPEAKSATLVGETSEGAAEAINRGLDAPAKEASSGFWSGLVALMAVLGMGVGGVALWQANAMQERLAGIEAQSDTTSAESSGPDTDYIDLQERLGALSSENERLQVEFARLESRFEERLAGQEQQLADAAEPSPLVEATPVPAAPPAGKAQTPARTEPAAQKVVAESEPAATGVPAAKPGWAVNLQSFANKEKAESALARVIGMDVPATIAPALIKGKTWYRLRVGFANQQEAQAFANSVRSKPGLSSAWLSRE